ncbi:unnamed protein product [Arabis nemorensis]|uniref:Uncharacterized protein n=1 Tax=Arabis nemorensis TaxID=586526 RepID=A0A565CNN0_9BRAS|nr:unnamed protein product [Arabis nemorensis]
MEFALERETLSVPGPDAAFGGNAGVVLRSICARKRSLSLAGVLPHRREAILRAPSRPLPAMVLAEPLALFRPSASAPPSRRCASSPVSPSPNDVASKIRFTSMAHQQMVRCISRLKFKETSRR